MSRYTYVPTEAGYEVYDPSLGFIGWLEREMHPGNNAWWKPTTPDGESLKAAPGGRDPSAGWLRYQADPSLLEPKKEPDAILDAITEHLEAGDRLTAISVLLSALSEDISQMRAGRRTHPAALWVHLERYARWLETAGFRAADNRPADRLAHLRAVKARETA